MCSVNGASNLYSSKWKEVYKKKLTSAEMIAKHVKSDDVCASTCIVGEPYAIINAILDRIEKEDLSGITHHLLLSGRDHRFWQEKFKGKFEHVSYFCSPLARKAIKNGLADQIHTYYSDEGYLWQKYLKADIFYATVSPMDKHGYFSFGPCVGGARGQMSRAEKIFIEVNPNQPRVHGESNIHITEIDALCECDVPLPELKVAPIDERARKMSEYILELIPNASTIQLGIGAVPSAVAQGLKSKTDLNIHSEMFTDSMIDLIECGAVTNLTKPIHLGKSISTFSFGTRRTYDFLDDNPGVEFYPVGYTNDVNVISKHKNMISINAFIEVDLHGQVCAESVGPCMISGTGGQVDFVRGANKSDGGKAILTTYSTAETKNGTVSSIKPMLTEGAVVTTNKNDVDYIVTEHGVAQLKGKTMRQRARSLIAIAHPDFRDDLICHAKKMLLL